eukprot:TRINITY_DN20804_c0_g1_i1.p1 TRINITY_DN20804_c0_g1~~TRINITY_DN20804_c0_g1_i1.p1  ORF type:complete len:468 (-),score=101.24 TRINITY_DN20804_c0_g1_i1:58-1461(-)
MVQDLGLELRQAVAGQVKLTIIRELLSRKADPNQVGDSLAEFPLPLQSALESGQPELCRLLLLYQADPKPLLQRAKDLSIAVDASAEKKECAELVQKWDEDDCDTAGMLAMLEDFAADAARAHDVSALGRALASLDVAGGDAESCATKNNEGCGSLLHVCASSVGHGGDLAARATARALIGWGALPDCRNTAGKTPLQLALQVSRESVAQQSNGQTGASSSSSARREPARTLLESGADPEQSASAGSGETLLMEAARAGDVVACELLLEFGADPLRRGTAGQTAITLASEPNVPSQVLMLLRTALTRGLHEELPGSVQPLPQLATGSKMSGGRTRTAAGAFSKMTTHSTSDSGQPDIQRIQTAPPKMMMSMDDDDDDFGSPSRMPAHARLFSMSHEQEMASAEGLLNQVDLEEAYEDDWNVASLAEPKWSPRSDGPEPDTEKDDSNNGYPGEPSWNESGGRPLRVAG